MTDEIDSRLSEIDARCRTIECENRRLTAEARWYRRAIVAILGFGGILAIGGSAAPRKLDVVEATRFVLKDNEGRTRAVIACEEESETRSPYIDLIDKAGNSRLTLDLTPNEQPRVTFMDAADQIRSCLMLDKDGSPSHVFFAKDSKSLLLLGIEDSAGFQGIRAMSNDKDRFALSANSDGTTRLDILNQQGDLRLALRNREGVAEGKANGLSIRNENGDYSVLGRLGDGSIGLQGLNKDDRSVFLLHRRPGDDPRLRLETDDGGQVIMIPGPPPQ